MKRLVFSIVVFLVLIEEIRSQDPKMLNSNQSLLYLNPSFAGSNGGARVQLNYQKQWPEYSRWNFTTIQSAADVYVPAIKAAIGVSYMLDEFAKGTVRSNVLNLIYAQHIRLSENIKVIPSLQFSFRAKSLDVSSLHAYDPIDPRYGAFWDKFTSIPSARKTCADFSGGGLINYKKDLYLGVYYFHFNQPDEGLLGTRKLPAQLAFYASYNYRISESRIVQLAARVEDQMDNMYTQINLNAVLFKHLIAGIGVTNFDSGTLNLGARFDTFSFTGSYNYYHSKLAGSSLSIWEINTSFHLRNKENRHTLVNFENW